MKVDVRRERAAAPRGINRGRKVAARRALRRRVDERFDPPKALAATARYLRIARGALGRDDLAVVCYHMGIGNLQDALAPTARTTSPTRGCTSTPRRCATPRPRRRLAALGDDSSTYLWRVLAAEEIMRL